MQLSTVLSLWPNVLGVGFFFFLRVFFFCFVVIGVLVWGSYPAKLRVCFWFCIQELIPAGLEAPNGY